MIGRGIDAKSAPNFPGQEHDCPHLKWLNIKYNAIVMTSTLLYTFRCISVMKISKKVVDGWMTEVVLSSSFTF